MRELNNIVGEIMTFTMGWVIIIMMAMEVNQIQFSQHPCGRHDWIDTEYILYKDGIVALIVGQYQQSTTQFLYFRCCFFWLWQWFSI